MCGGGGGSCVIVVDRREIECDLEAVRLALEWVPQAGQAFALPPLVPAAVRCNPADGTVEVAYGQLTSTRVFILRPEALGAILIAYCNRASMPVPQDADKGVRIERNQVVIVPTLRMPEPPEPAVAEGPIARAREVVLGWAWMEQAH